VVMEHPSSSGYSCPLTLQLISPGSSSEVSALFSYDARDPYAVRMTFGSPSVDFQDAVTWLIGRELLRVGLDRLAGEGDVRVGPAAGKSEVLFLHLRAPSGEALLELPRTALAAFIRGTETLVPFGAESAAIDLDGMVAVILAHGGADPFSP
jgi:Streptomyces sporulation and cell division protein, SsgA